MSRPPARILGVAATLALAIAPVVSASPAGAARAPVRTTIAMGFATVVGEIAEMTSERNGVDGRSVRSLLEAQKVVGDVLADEVSPDLIRITGLTDRNHDGLDDDARVSVRVLSNAATLILRKNRSFSVVDAGFVFKNPRSVLKESAEAFDRVLRFAAAMEVDSWDMRVIKEIKAEMPTAVRVVSDYDANRDGFDDDGRLTFLANRKAVTLTIGNTGKQVGKVTYGPTWKTKAPTRVHRPLMPPYLGSALGMARR